MNLSGGRLEQGTQRFLVRTVNEFDTLEDMANAVIANVDGQPVYLKDVARVERGYKDRTAITRLNGDECIELAIYKEGDANTVQLAHGIRDKLEALEKTLPGGTKLVPVYDQSKFIASAVSDVKDAAILGGLLSILVLYFFLRDAWATIVTGIVIPVTVVGIFVMMYAFDLTLNVMSLGGIALSVGMLIDNSVVILEAIARRKEAGLSTIDAAREGTAEVATAVTASTLTSVAVFFPMVFVSGIAGPAVPRPGAHRHFRPAHLAHGRHHAGAHAHRLARAPRRQGSGARARRRRAARNAASRCAATCARSVRNFRVARYIVPRFREDHGRSSFCAGMWRWFAWLAALPRDRRGARAAHLLRTARQTVRRRCSRRSCGSPRRATTFSTATTRRCSTGRWTRRAAVLFTAFGLLAATALILPSLGTELIPQLSQGEFTVKMRLPAGSPLETTDRQVQVIHNAARNLPNLDSAYAVAGTGNRLDANPVDSGENTGNLDVKLRAPIDKEGEERAIQEMRDAPRRAFPARNTNSRALRCSHSRRRSK